MSEVLVALFLVFCTSFFALLGSICGTLLVYHLASTSVKTKKYSYTNILPAQTDEDIDLIASVRAATEELQSDNLSPQFNPESSLQELTETLSSLTAQIANSVDSADQISSQDKRELGNLLQPIPAFISQISTMNPNEIKAVLQGAKQEDEAEYLSNVLDRLRNSPV